MYASAIEDACNAPISERIISFVARKASSVIQCSPPPVVSSLGDHWSGGKGARAQHQPQYQYQYLVTPPATPTSPRPRGVPPSCAANPEPARAVAVPPLTVFIAQVVKKSRAQAQTLLATLVYLDRLQRRLPRAAKGMHCTCHRVFLAAFILAAKYTNDSSPINKHWAKYASVFSLAEVNLMEKQLLLLLDFNLRIDETDLLLQVWPFREYGPAGPPAWTAARCKASPSPPPAAFLEAAAAAARRRNSAFEVPEAGAFAPPPPLTARRVSICGGGGGSGGGVDRAAWPALFRPPAPAFAGPVPPGPRASADPAARPARAVEDGPAADNGSAAPAVAVAAAAGPAASDDGGGAHPALARLRATTPGRSGPPHVEHLPVRGEYRCQAAAGGLLQPAASAAFACPQQPLPAAPFARGPVLFHDGRKLQQPAAFHPQRSIL